VSEIINIESEYIKGTGENRIVDFPKYFLDALLADGKLASFVSFAKLPDGREYFDDSLTYPQKEAARQVYREERRWLEWAGRDGVVLFGGCSLAGMVIRLAEWWANMLFVTPELHKGLFGKFVIKQKTEGLFNKKMVGVEVKGNGPGLSEIRNDVGLIEKIFSLFQSKCVMYGDYKNFKINEIRFSVIKNPFRWFGGSREAFGGLETGLTISLEGIRRKNQDYAVVCKTSFEVINRIAEHLSPFFANISP